MNNIYSSVAEFWIQTYLKQGAAGGRVRNVMNIAVILCQNGHIAQRSPAQPRQQPSRDGWTALVLPTGNLTSYLAMSALRYRPSFSKKKPLCCHFRCCSFAHSWRFLSFCFCWVLLGRRIDRTGDQRLQQRIFRPELLLWRHTPVLLITEGVNQLYL